MTPSDGTTPIGSFTVSCLANSGPTLSGSPTSMICVAPSEAALTAPATISAGAWSPPMASTATRMSFSVVKGTPSSIA